MALVWLVLVMAAGAVPIELTGTPTRFVAGEVAQVEVSSGSPGLGAVLVGTAGAYNGAACTGFGCVDIVSPSVATTFQRGVGRQDVAVPIPAGFPYGDDIWYQAVQLDGKSMVKQARVLGPCVRDAAEPDDDDTTATLAVDGQYSGWACDDPDVFLLDVPADTLVSLQLRTAALEGAAVVHVTAAPGVLVQTVWGPGWSGVDVFVSADTELRWTVDPTADADRGLRVGTRYRLDVFSTALPPLVACTEDPLESNGTVAIGAPPLSIDATVCEDRGQDRFSITTVPGVTYDVFVTWDPSEGDVGLSAIDPSLPGWLGELAYVMTEVAPGQGQVRVPADDATVIDLYLTTASGDLGALGVDYSLEIAPSASRLACAPDASEDDDTVGAATVLAGSATISGRTACPLDPDVFVVDMTAGDRIEAWTTAASDTEGAWVQLVDPDGWYVDVGTQVAVSDAAPGLWSLVVLPRGDDPDPFADDTYPFRVGITDGAPYTLDIVMGPTPVPQACVGDALEPDSDQAPTTLPLPGSRAGLTLCAAGDADWFRVWLNLSDRLEVYATAVDDEGLLDVQVLPPRASSYAVPDAVWIDDRRGEQVVAWMTGWHLVKVTLDADIGEGEEGTRYDLAMRYTP